MGYARSLLAGALVLTLPLCGSEAQETIDPLDYLVGTVCADGAPPIVSPCSQARRQKADDRMLWRRHDWPAPTGYQIEDAFLAGKDEAELIWSYPPFGPFAAVNGDGGEVYRIDRQGKVTISLTQDGGKPYLQHFIGPACGGTGWVVFSATAPKGGWASEIATLADRRGETPCTELDQAFTRWRRETVSIPFIVRGKVRTVAVPAIISEHYDGPGLAQSRHLERSFFGRGFGRLVWEAWGTEPPKVADLPARCPGTSFSTAPAAGWLLEDCRYATNLVPADGTMSGAKFAWPK
jgi:hypothetical protein